MDLGMSAVKKHGLGTVAGDHCLLQKFEESVQREAVEELKNGSPLSEFWRKGAPCDSIEEDIPDGIEMSLPNGHVILCRHKVVAINLEFLDLIF